MLLKTLHSLSVFFFMCRRDFEILPVAVGENKSPVLHAEHTLGLEEWCVRHLYLHVYHKLMNLKQHQRLRREGIVFFCSLFIILFVNL